MDYTINQYRNGDMEIWDAFIDESVNGTFLQKRVFLNYHPKNRFVDNSLLFYCKDKLVAVCPGCIVNENNKKIFVSHQGSTYGGLILCEQLYRTEKILALIESMEEYLKNQGVSTCILKQTMDLLTTIPSDLIEFCLGYKGYTEYKEISTYIDLKKVEGEIIKSLSKMKQRLVKKCIKEKLEFKKLESKNEIADFHRVLTINLEKYNKKPVHTVEELWDLKYNRLQNEIEFFGAYLDGQLVSGTMVFLFEKTKCAHTQYLAADLEYNKLSPMTYVYYKTEEEFLNRGYNYLSWGISTEERGCYINMGLTNSKEEFGSRHELVRIYEKQL